MKNNPDNLPEELQLQQNYIGANGRAALKEAMEDVYELYDHTMTITF